MQKDQFCNLTCHVARYMQLVRGEWIIFDLLNSYLAPRLGGIKQKKFVLFIAEPQDDFFCFIPSSPEAKYEFYYYQNCYCQARRFFWCHFPFVLYESSRGKSPALSDSPVHPLPPASTYKVSFQYYQNEEQDRVDTIVTYSSNKSFSLRRW